jgi:hypothetical protein
MSRKTDGTVDGSGDRRVFEAVLIEPSDTSFERSLERLSLHLAARQPGPPLKKPESGDPWSLGMVLSAWPYAVALGMLTLALAVNQYAPLIGDVLRDATSTTADAAPKPAASAAKPPREPWITTTAMQAAVPAVALELPLEPLTKSPPSAPTTPLDNNRLDASEMLELQRRLAGIGVDPGPLDGIPGPRTIAAVQRYEELKGWPQTGKMDRRILKLLEKDPGNASERRAASD